MLNVMKSRLNGKTFLQISFFTFLLIQICFAQGSWTQIGDMPEIRYGHTVNELDGKIYVVGGLNTEGGVSPRTALVYDMAETTWTTIPLYNNEIRWAHTSCVVDGKLYVIGGNDGNGTIATMDMFDPNTGQWESKDSMSIDRGLAASALVYGKIYVMGGMRAEGGILYLEGLKTIEAYDPLTNTWDSTLADMPTKRWGHSAVAYSGKIYVFGGRSTGVPYSSIEVYDPQFNTWETISDSTIPTPRYCLTTCVLDSNIYAIGGWYHSGGGPIYDKVEVYNPESNMWYTETPMPTPLAVLASIVLDGKIQVFGGSITTHPCIGSSGIYEFSTGDPLSEGTYTIGSSGYFSSIQSAFDKLGTDGVAGPVTLELIDELYTAPTDSFGFKLNGPIPGAGLNSRITIKPAENKNVVIEGNGLAVLYFINTSYVTFDGVSITGSTTLTVHTYENNQFAYNLGLFFIDNSDNNIIQNSIFINDDILRKSPALCVSSLSYTAATPDSNLIQSNFVKKAGIGIYVSAYYSTVPATANSNIIRKNIIGSETDNLISWGIEVVRNQNAIIEDNVIEGIRGASSDFEIAHGISCYACLESTIRNNIVHNVNTSYTGGSMGIALLGDGSNVGNGNLVYNNMVYDINSSSSASWSNIGGIHLEYQNNTKVYYNSVYLSGTGANHQGSGAFYIFGPGSSNSELKNNIFVNTRDESPYCASAIYVQTASSLVADYNDLYYDDTNNNNCLVRAGGTDYLTLADWQATGQDLNSISEMPNFVTPDLHIDAGILTLLDGGATPIAGIDTDIDGEIRNATVPDIGADEFLIVGVEDEISLPTEFALEQNYPNPFNPSTTFRYSIPTQSKVVIKIYDILSNEIATLMDEEKTVGTYELTWYAETLPSGVYFYQLRAGDFIDTKKMLLLK